MLSQAHFRQLQQPGEMFDEEAAAKAHNEAKRKEAEVKAKEGDLARKAEELKRKEEEFERKLEAESKRNPKVDDKVEDADVAVVKTLKKKTKTGPSFSEAVKNAKKQIMDELEMQKFEVKMIGGEAKVLCDKCEFKANNMGTVRNHWNKKHKREAQEDEEAKLQGKLVKPLEAKKMKADLDKTKRDWRDDYDEYGNSLEESTARTFFDESAMETELAQDLTSTPMPKSNVGAYNEDKMNMKVAELESLKEAMKEKEDMMSIAYARIASL